MISFILVALVIVAIVWYAIRNLPTNSVDVQKYIEDGKKPFNSNIALPQSFNEKEGIALSYTCWLKVDDFAYRYGQQKVVFTKGPVDLSSSCPSLLIDGNTNSLLVKIDTFGATEIIPVSNIPAKKWMHVGIVIDQDSVDVYINGIIHTHHTLVQVPRQNEDTLHTGVGGGFDGKVASIEYYPRFLSASEIKNSMNTTPSPDPADKGIGSMPPYFDITWWSKSS
jgi:hypothetical protein